MRWFLRFLFQLAAAVVLFVVITVAWIIFDGLNDIGDSADAALVVGRDEYSSDGVAEVERVAKLYKDGEFHKIIVSAANPGVAFDEQTSITKYLEGHGVPSGAIIEVTGAESLGEMAHDVASIMKSHELMSVMLVTDYYRMSRLKLALLHAGVADIEKTHIGSVRKEDALPIAHEVFALYDYVGRTFLVPAAKKIKDEAATAGDKAKVEAEKAKDNVNKGLDTLPK